MRLQSTLSRHFRPLDPQSAANGKYSRFIAGHTDAAAVRHLLVFGELAHAPVERLALGGLERYERPLPVKRDNDLLLAEVAEVAL